MLLTEGMLTPAALRTVLLATLALALAAVCTVVLRPFVVPVTWAAILAYASWPVFVRVRRACGPRPRTAAALMTLLVSVMLIAPATLLALAVEDEIMSVLDAASQLRAGSIVLPDAVRALPGLGPWLQQTLERYAADPAAARHVLEEGSRALHTDVPGAAFAMLRNLAKLLLALLTVFYLYRDGPALRAQLLGLSRRAFGDGVERYAEGAGAMVRAVVYGLLFSGLAQGLLATGGYLIVGAPAPVLLGALTAVAAIVPLFGTVLVWGPVSATLLLSGHTMDAAILVAWGVIVVHPADNVIKLMVISSATEMPLLLVLFGVVGGLAAFGLVGVFVGPVALAVATALWRDLAQPARPDGGKAPQDA
jgi:predicted PurR-regulated permease PerM